MSNHQPHPLHNITCTLLRVLIVELSDKKLINIVVVIYTTDKKKMIDYPPTLIVAIVILISTIYFLTLWVQSFDVEGWLFDIVSVLHSNEKMVKTIKHTGSRTSLATQVFSSKKASPKKDGTWARLPSSGPRSARWMAASWRGAKSALPHIFRSSAHPTGLRPMDLVDWIEHEPDRFEEQIRMKVRYSRGKG